MWVNGPFKPGWYNDDAIVRQMGFRDALGSFEHFLADSIYSGWRAIFPTGRDDEELCLVAP